MTPKKLRELRLEGSLSLQDIKEALNIRMSLQYDGELTNGLDYAYDNELTLASKAIGLSMRELSDLAMTYHIPERYRY